jgi:hypothetical protein
MFSPVLGLRPMRWPFFADDKRSERRQLHCFAAFQTVGDFLEHKLNESGGFDSRQADFLIDRLA